MIEEGMATASVVMLSSVVTFKSVGLVTVNELDHLVSSFSLGDANVQVCGNRVSPLTLMVRFVDVKLNDSLFITKQFQIWSPVSLNVIESNEELVVPEMSTDWILKSVPFGKNI